LYHPTNPHTNCPPTLILGTLLALIAGLASLEHDQWLSISQGQGWKHSPTHALVVFIVSLFKKVPTVCPGLSEYFGMDPFASLHVFAVYLGLVFMQFGRPGDTLFIWHTTKSNQSKNKFGVKLNFDSQHQFLLLKSHTTPQESAPPSKIWVLQRDEFTSTFFKTGKSSTGLEASDVALLERFGTRNLSAFESLLPPSPVPVNTVDIIMTLGILAKMLENKRTHRMGNPVPTLRFLQKYALLDVTNNFFAQLFPTEDGAYEKMRQFQKSFRWRQWDDVEDLDELLPNNSTVRLAVSSLSPWVISFYNSP
jgi:hypothetical protein